MWRSLYLLPSLVSAALLLAPVSATAQVPDDPFKPVDPIRMPLDKEGVWTLHFAYLPPRIVTVDTPAGKKTAWYMVYKVWNTSDTPVTIAPTFELVTKDGTLATFLDDIQPMVFKQIRAIEDPSISAEKPNGELNIQSSITISQNKIPVTKPESVPREVYGVAIWMGVSEKAPTTNNFSVYVGGLSNGVAVQERDGGEEAITVKTLQLDFFKPTDVARPGQNDIQPNENGGLGEWQWVYRAVPTRKAGAPARPDAEQPRPEPKKADN